jgi:hypothetical protein
MLQRSGAGMPSGGVARNVLFQLGAVVDPNFKSTMGKVGSEFASVQQMINSKAADSAKQRQSFEEKLAGSLRNLNRQLAEDAARLDTQRFDKMVKASESAYNRLQKIGEQAEKQQRTFQERIMGGDGASAGGSVAASVKEGAVEAAGGIESLARALALMGFVEESNIEKGVKLVAQFEVIASAVKGVRGVVEGTTKAFAAYRVAQETAAKTRLAQSFVSYFSSHGMAIPASVATAAAGGTAGAGTMGLIGAAAAPIAAGTAAVVGTLYLFNSKFREGMDALLGDLGIIESSAEKMAREWSSQAALNHRFTMQYAQSQYAREDNQGELNVLLAGVGKRGLDRERSMNNQRIINSEQGLFNLRGDIAGLERQLAVATSMRDAAGRRANSLDSVYGWTDRFSGAGAANREAFAQATRDQAQWTDKAKSLAEQIVAARGRESEVLQRQKRDLQDMFALAEREAEVRIQGYEKQLSLIGQMRDRSEELAIAGRRDVTGKMATIATLDPMTRQKFLQASQAGRNGEDLSADQQDLINRYGSNFDRSLLLNRNAKRGRALLGDFNPFDVDEAKARHAAANAQSLEIKFGKLEQTIKLEIENKAKLPDAAVQQIKAVLQQAGFVDQQKWNHVLDELRAMHARNASMKASM